MADLSGKNETLRGKLGPAILSKGLRGSDALLALSKALGDDTPARKTLAAIYRSAAMNLRAVEHSTLETVENDHEYD